jgi:hypothetical protein
MTTATTETDQARGSVRIEPGAKRIRAYLAASWSPTLPARSSLGEVPY